MSRNISITSQKQDLYIFIGLLLTGAVLGFLYSVNAVSTHIIAAVLGSMVVFLAFTRAYFVLYLFIPMIMFSPEIVVGSLPGRDIVVRIEDILILLLVLSLFAKAIVHKSKPLTYKTPLNVSIFLYVFIFILTTAKGILVGDVQHFKGFFYIAKFIQYLFVFFVVMSHLKDSRDAENHIKIFIFLFMVTLFAANLFGLTQIGAGERIAAPFEGERGEPNTLGGFQVLMLSMAVGSFLYAKNFWLKALLLGLIASTLPPFLFTLSRSSYLAMGAMYLAFIWFDKKSRLLLSFCLFVFICGGAALLPEKVHERIRYTFIAQQSQQVKTVTLGGVSLDPSASSRLRSWMTWFERWKKKPFLGYGVTGAGFIDGQYVRTFIELGGIGFIIFLNLLWVIHRNVFKVFRRTENNFYKGIALGFLAGHIGMLTHAIAANTFIIVRIMEPYWFLAAIVLSIPYVEKLSIKKQEDGVVKFKKREGVRNTDVLLNYGNAS